MSRDLPKAPAASIPDVFDPTCSSRHALELIASKWAMLIISALEEGPMRNAALMRRLGDVSQKMLTQTLKELERNGLVIREDRKTVPPHVVYSLSPVGRSLSETLLVLDRWAETHFGALDAARERYDAERGK
ncbi:helix-turn-helix transcriptional regulator [Ensifer sp. HO-A22]|uniref:Helix-turn-helix transcriptional regulator n=1 Tax=Ensifer oleiphilus TaxID=2742698 RepID=A0A7Y6Q1Y8_9HYPH|nr:helix-turn-helix domain-containing protein [Ensifer oleiphilus]NVD37579.1 helix-turn-helix transcriptional regulator [Ensifer oleiphilus]